MTRYIGRPIDPRTGRERMGTAGVISGNYRSVETMRRYLVRCHGAPGVAYNVYTRGVGRDPVERVGR